MGYESAALTQASSNHRASLGAVVEVAAAAPARTAIFNLVRSWVPLSARVSESSIFLVFSLSLSIASLMCAVLQLSGIPEFAFSHLDG